MKISQNLAELEDTVFKSGFLEKVKHDLGFQGAVVIAHENLPWTLEELTLIEEMTSPDNLEFKRSEYGDTGERNPVSYFRILHPTIHDTSLPECMKILDAERVKDFLCEVTGMVDYTIDRCQIHLYEQGDFISEHIDGESCPDYIYSTVLILSEGYGGGEFVVYKDGNAVSLKPDKFSMIVVKSCYPHEVKEVTSGTRRTLCFFLKETS